MNNNQISFNRESWIIKSNKEIRYENMRHNLKEMDVLKAFIYQNKDKE
jgi:hypothetical protein